MNLIFGSKIKWNQFTPSFGKMIGWNPLYQMTRNLGVEPAEKTHSSGTILPGLVTKKVQCKKPATKNISIFRIFVDFLRDFMFFQGGVGYFSNERRFSVEYSLQRISSIFVVETKRFVGSFVNVILTRQTCGLRSSRAAESKRRALGNYFSKRICYMFPISKCRKH